jgi:hypothetical protein
MTLFSSPVQGVSLSYALREAATHAPAGRVVLATYEFTHSLFVGRALIVANHENWVALDENGVSCTFIAFAGLRVGGFDESDQAALPTLKLRLDGVSTLIVDKLDLAVGSLEPVGLIERIYVSDDTTGPALLPVANTLIRVGTVTETRVDIECGFGDPSNQPFPRKNYTRSEYISLAVQ